MSNPKEQYTREMHEKFGYLAIWAPNFTLKLGDVGRFKQHEFSFITTLNQMGIKFRERRGDMRASYEYRSAGGVSVQVKAAGEAPIQASPLATAEAGVIIKFERANAVYFRAEDAVIHTILDQDKLGKDILARYELGEWEEDMCVVTELITAGSATILISNEKNAHVAFKAGANFNLAVVDVASALGDLAVVSSEKIQTRILSENKLTPLFKARKVRKSFLGAASFRDSEQGSFGELSYAEVSAE